MTTEFALQSTHGPGFRSIRWYAHGDNMDGSCSKEAELGSDPTALINMTAPGTLTIYATVSYNDGPGIPAPPDETVSVTMHPEPPDGFRIIPFDNTIEYMLGVFPAFDPPYDGYWLQIQLTYHGVDCSGAGINVFAREKIKYSVPANKPDEFGGDWGFDERYFKVGGPGFLDFKALPGPNLNGIGLGEVVWKYTQTVGIMCPDWCRGETDPIPIGKLEVTQKRSPTDFDKWLLNVTKLPDGP